MTMEKPVRIETPLASIQRTTADLVEIRIKPGNAITSDAIQGLIAQIDAHGLAAPRQLLVLLPDEEVQFSTAVMNSDHFAGRPKGMEGRRMAVVAPSTVDRQLARLYFTFFPSPIYSQIFSTEAEARVWLASS